MKESTYWALRPKLYRRRDVPIAIAVFVAVVGLALLTGNSIAFGISLATALTVVAAVVVVMHRKEKRDRYDRWATRVTFTVKVTPNGDQVIGGINGRKKA